MKTTAHFLTALAILVMAGICQAEDKGADAPKPADKARPDPENCPACSLGLTAEFVFKRLDVDEDKFVTVSEFRRSPGMDDEAKALDEVRRMDKDGDEKLSWQEFETVYQERHANCKKPDPSKTPAANPDGRGGDGSRFAKVFMMQSDKNGDGEIDKSEFRGQPMGFDRLDKNKNGFIEKDELGELHQRRMADPQSMKERLQTGDLPKSLQDKKTTAEGGKKTASILTD